MNVTVYSTATCGFCRALKGYLADKSIKYTEKMVDQDAAAAQEMITKSGQMGVPFTVVEKDDGTETTILGYDLPRLNALFN